MDIPQILTLLEKTLNPSTIHEASQTLLSERQKPGFITNLLVISADNQYNLSIRQSALIYIKNAIIDDFNKTIDLSDNDYDTVKSSILQALIRNCEENYIFPTIREIVFVLAEQQFPQNWHEVIPEIVNIIQNSGDFKELFGSIEALKAIVSAVVKRVDVKLTLNNVCNKTVLPLLSLASKLFQNYNEATSQLLISIFKIFSTITNFHIPEIIVLNMHSWMLFIKKILDLNIEAGNIDMNMYSLKKICLRTLFRFYQRHLNRKFSSAGQEVIDEFHSKFTKGITESLLLQIINEGQMAKNSLNKNYIQLTKYSLACLAYVYEEDRDAAKMIDNYKEKIIYLCLERYKTKTSKNYSSYGEFASKLNEQRAHLCQFITSLIKNQTKKEEEAKKGNFNYYNSSDVTSILGCLYMHIEKGDNEMKELCLYIYSCIASVLPESDSDIQSKMLTFILQIVKPLLNLQETPTIIKLRCCEILSQYSYIQIPENELTDIAGGVYGCLISTSNHPDSASIETFLQIHSVYAFNSLLRFDSIINFTSPHLKNILQVYTSLLEIEVSMIKCLEDMLAKFEPHLQPYGNGLIEMLTNMFFKYNELISKRSNEQSQNQNQNQNNQKNTNGYDSDDEDGNESADNNYLNASKACLGTIRQIIQIPEFVLENDQNLHNILLLIFTDNQMLYVEEGFNILNQILFKAKNLKQEYNIYLSLILFGILPVTENYINNLKMENSSYSNTLYKMLECQCTDPDPDFIENTIGCIRNFISKYQQGLRNQFDKSGMSFLELLLSTVKYVHENQSSKATQSERSIILTIYISLIEWKALENSEVKEILQTVATWLNMEKDMYQNLLKNGNLKKEEVPKPIYCPIYLQIILLGCHFYPEVTLNLLNGNFIANELLESWERFHVDYEISRLLVGIADLLSSQSITEQNTSAEIMNRLPDTIDILCKMRSGEFCNVLESEDEEAEEERFFGMDENTHIMGWGRPNIQPAADRQQEGMEDEEESDDEEDDEFNKYYESPLENIDEVAYIFNALKSQQCEAYMNFMTNESQEKLSYLVLNAPPKFGQPQNN